MFIAVDKNQYLGSHEASNAANHAALEHMGHTLVQTLLPYGDYALMTPAMTDTLKRRGSKFRRWDYVGMIPTVIDRKSGMVELAQNLCSSKEEHERFHNEYRIARNCHCNFYVLVEDEKIRCIDDVEHWINPRSQQYFYQKAMEKRGYHYQRPLPSQPPVSGKQLAKTLRTVEEKYGVRFAFCTPQEAPSAIEYLLTH